MWLLGRNKREPVDFDEPMAPERLGNPEKDPEKQRTAHRPLVRWTVWVAVAALGAGTIAASAGVGLSAAADTVLDLWEDLPTNLPLDRPLPQHTVLLDKDGKEFARIYSKNRIDVRLDQVSAAFKETLIATEDARFYEHHGVDPFGIARALIHNASNEDVQGASTITQQLVQNILVNNARNGVEEMVAAGNTYNAKIREARYALALEQQLSKDEILTRYMNAVYFGNGAYGVEAAARTYFSTTAAKLDHVQSALLVGLLKAPVSQDPFTHPEAATERRNTVLTVLERRGVLTPDKARAAREAPLGVKLGSVPSGCGGSKYPWYCEAVREELLTNPVFGATPEARQALLYQGGLTLTTGLDPKAAQAAQAAVEKALGNDNRVALGTAVVEPGTGHIAAIAQNRGWGKGKGKTQVVYAKSAFQVGSAMKPIVLATALSQGIPASTRLLANGPYRTARLDNPAGGYINYNNRNYGVINAYQAIRSSVNVYFVRLIERVGVINVAKMARTLGISSIPVDKLTGREASLALGAYEVSPLEMANAYAAFMSGGVVCTPVAVIKAERSDTKEKLRVPDPGCHRAIDRGVADTVADALKEPFKPKGTLGQLHGLKGREAGAKTGTTNDFAANWIVGGTPQLTAAVWLGDPRGGAEHPLTQVEAYGKTYYDLTGAEVAGPVWKATMEGALKGREAVRLPDADPSLDAR
ncbi:transglycosylase domain-containing protein [Arthrobacter sp. GCM10027362]|uniref:transglycosylase domain-containing protein n=1 Tax=Arthrobacter sp. GCM10027362 TaxID=3273379 RepID=UPI00363A15E6